jgi:hypothetical protein
MRDLGKQKLKLTDVLYVIEFLLKDKIKAIDKQMGTNAVIGAWFVWFEGTMWKINFNECHRERCFVENKPLSPQSEKVVIKTCLSSLSDTVGFISKITYTTSRFF